MNDTLDDLLERGLAEHAGAVQHAPGAAVVVARARRQARRQRLLGAGLALVVGAGVVAAVPLLARTHHDGASPAAGDVIISDLGDGKSLVWDHAAESSPLICLVEKERRVCELAVTGAGGTPAVHVTGDAVFGLVGRQFRQVTVGVGDGVQTPARLAPAGTMTAFVYLGSTRRPGTDAQATVTVSAVSVEGDTVRTITDGPDNALKVEPASVASLVTLRQPDPAQQRPGVYAWTRGDWGCLTWGEAKAGPPSLADLQVPAWCQRLPEERTAISLGWTDDPADTTQMPSAINLLVPASTTRVTFAGHVMQLSTVDDLTWATLPGNPWIDDVRHAPIVVTTEDGDWHSSYLETALRGPMP